MYAAVTAGVVQKRIGESARRFQESVESGAQTVVGVNAYRVDEDRSARTSQPKPDPRKMQEHIAAFRAYKAARSQEAVGKALDALARAANDPAPTSSGKWSARPKPAARTARSAARSGARWDSGTCRPSSDERP